MSAATASIAEGLARRKARATAETGRRPIPRWHADPQHCACDDEVHDLVIRDHQHFVRCRACGTETPAPRGALVKDPELLARRLGFCARLRIRLFAFLRSLP